LKRIGGIVLARIIQAVKRNVHIIIMFLPILSFIAPFLILYSLYAWSFEQTFHGRTFLLFFLWLVVLEIISSREKLQNTKVNKLRSIRTVLFIIALLLPTIYVVAANYYGINTIISDLTSHCISPSNMDPSQKNVTASFMPISIEYLVFAVLFCLIILLVYGINILEDFSISTFFLGIIGMLFTIDFLYPYGKFTPLQIPVPATATLAANVLNLMGYQTSMYFRTDSVYGYMPYLTASDPKNASRYVSRFGIAWPCAGVESLLIYTVIILLFLKGTGIHWKHKILYFAIGAVVTYFINILRIVSIFLISMDYGYPSTQAALFHNFYGMLYSITWIVSYPLIIIGSRALWGKIKNWKTDTKKIANFPTRTKLSD
jgi:exosortase/archaeosortase family protein